MEIRVKITPQVKHEGVEALPDGRIHVRVNAPRKQGAANERMCSLVAEHFRVPIGSVTIVKGHTLPTKTVSIRGK